jgi:hypothetical protein
LIGRILWLIGEWRAAVSLLLPFFQPSTALVDQRTTREKEDQRGPREGKREKGGDDQSAYLLIRI